MIELNRFEIEKLAVWLEFRGIIAIFFWTKKIVKKGTKKLKGQYQSVQKSHKSVQNHIRVQDCSNSNLHSPNTFFLAEKMGQKKKKKIAGMNVLV